MFITHTSYITVQQTFTFWYNVIVYLCVQRIKPIVTWKCWRWVSPSSCLENREQEKLKIQSLFSGIHICWEVLQFYIDVCRYSIMVILFDIILEWLRMKYILLLNSVYSFLSRYLTSSYGTGQDIDERIVEGLFQWLYCF